MKHLIQHAWPVVCLAALALSGAGCGPSEDEQRAQAAKKRAAKKKATYRRCASTFDELLTEIGDLDSRLAVGLNYDDYGERVANVRVAYDRVEKLGEKPSDVRCLAEVGVPLEQALNLHVRAVGVWRDCVEDLYCDSDGIDSALQRRWRKARTEIEGVEAALDEMRP